MTDSVVVFPPGFRFEDANGDPLPGGKGKFYLAGTSTAMTVYSDKELLTAIGVTVTADAGGYPSVSGTKQPVYVGTAPYKIVITDADDATIVEHDNLKGAVTSPTTVTEAKRNTPVISKTSAYSVVLADWGKLINANPTGGTFALTLPSAVTVGDGFTIGIRHVGTANTVPLIPVLSQTISHSGKAVSAKALTSYGEGFWLVSDGANWHVDSYTPPAMTGRLPNFLVTDRLTAPPTSPIGGKRYIINGTPTGVWSTYAQHDVVEADGNGGWIKYTPAEGWFAYVEDENLFTAFVGTAWSDQTGMPTPSSATRKVAIFQDQKASGTDGGSFAAGSWIASALNTSVFNNNTDASLATNRVTLPAGTYRAVASRAFSGGSVGTSGAARIRLYNDTAAAALAYSLPTSQLNPGGAPMGGNVVLDVTFTLSVTSVIGIDHYGAGTTLGLGKAVGTGAVEVYASLMIEDLATYQGPAGATGPQGADGLDAAYAYTWSTSTSGDPGTGKIAINNVDPGAASQIQISETDAVGVGMAAVLATWDDSTSSPYTARLIISKEGATNNRIEFKIIGTGTDQGSYWTFLVEHVTNNGSRSNGDNHAVNVIPYGNVGATGPAGVTGSTSFTFSTTTADADPGSGTLRLNNATIASVTAAYVDNLNSGASTISPWLDTFDDTGDSAYRGDLHIYSTASALTVFAMFKISGSVVDGTGYRKLTLSYVAGPGGFTNGSNVIMAFLPRGATGAGDTTGPASSTDNAIVRFDGTTGKVQQNSGVIIDDSNNITGVGSLALGSGSVINWNSGDGTLTHSSNVLTWDGVAQVFNEAGADLDFRVEGDTIANLFFVDASTDRIGFGINTPAYEFDFSRSIAGRSGLQIANTSASASAYAQVAITSDAGAMLYQMASSTGGGAASLYSSATGGMAIYTTTATSLSLGANNNGSRLIIASSGAVTIGVSVDVTGSAQMDSLRIDQTQVAIGTGTKTISSSADSSTNFGKYFTINLNGTTVYVPCSTVAPT